MTNANLLWRAGKHRLALHGTVADWCSERVCHTIGYLPSSTDTFMGMGKLNGSLKSVQNVGMEP